MDVKWQKSQPQKVERLGFLTRPDAHLIPVVLRAQYWDSGP